MFNNALDTEDIGIRSVTIKGEAVAHFVWTHVTRNSTEAENREGPIVVIRFQNSTDVCKSDFILIRCVSYVMKWSRGWRIAITCGVIDCPHERDLPTRAQIVEECWPYKDLRLCKTVNSVAIAQSSVSLTAQFIDCCLATSENIALRQVSASKLDRSIFVISAHFTQVISSSITILFSRLWISKISCGDKRVSAWDLFLNLNSPREFFTTHAHTASSHIVNASHGKAECYRLVWFLYSIRANYDLATVTIAMFVSESSSEHLCASTHELAHSGVDFADCVVVAISITINHDKLKVLDLLEEVIAFHACREIWVERIHNLLCPAKFSPVAVSLFKH